MLMGNKEETMKVCGTILEHYLNEINANEKFVGMLKPWRKSNDSTVLNVSSGVILVKSNTL